MSQVRGPRFGSQKPNTDVPHLGGNSGYPDCVHTTDSAGNLYQLVNYYDLELTRTATCHILKNGKVVGSFGDAKKKGGWDECEWGGSYTLDINSGFLAIPLDGPGCIRSLDDRCITGVSGSGDPVEFCAPDGTGWTPLHDTEDGGFGVYGPSEYYLYAADCSVVQKRGTACACHWIVKNNIKVVDMKCLALAKKDAPTSQGAGMHGGGSGGKGTNIPTSSEIHQTISKDGLCGGVCKKGKGFFGEKCDDDDECVPCCKIAECVGLTAINDLFQVIADKIVAGGGEVTKDQLMNNVMETVVDAAAQTMADCTCS